MPVRLTKFPSKALSALTLLQWKYFLVRHFDEERGELKESNAKSPS
ncbi:MAG: hypothetical protein ACO1N4_12145 [Pedobacter sp.]